MTTTTDPAEAITPTAAALACAVHDRDRASVAEILHDLDRQQLYALAVVLASLVDIDRPPADHTTVLWTAIGHAATAYDIEADAIRGPSRTGNVARARMVAMTVAHRGGMSASEIGRRIGRDHSTVLYGIARVAHEPRLRAVADRICRALDIEWRQAA